MNRTWKVAIDLVDAGGVRRNDPLTPVGPDYAVRRILEELARARSLADELADRLRQAAASSPRLP